MVFVTILERIEDKIQFQCFIHCLPISNNYQLRVICVFCVTCFFCIIVSEYTIFHWFDHDIKQAVKIIDMNIQHNIVKGVIFYNIF